MNSKNKLFHFWFHRGLFWHHSPLFVFPYDLFNETKRELPKVRFSLVQSMMNRPAIQCSLFLTFSQLLLSTCRITVIGYVPWMFKWCLMEWLNNQIESLQQWGYSCCKIFSVQINSKRSLGRFPSETNPTPSQEVKVNVK